MPFLEAYGRYQKACLWPAVLGTSGHVAYDGDGNAIVTAQEPSLLARLPVAMRVPSGE